MSVWSILGWLNSYNYCFSVIRKPNPIQSGQNGRFDFAEFVRNVFDGLARNLLAHKSAGIIDAEDQLPSLAIHKRTDSVSSFAKRASSPLKF